ncbi:hypothetical protein [Rhodococcus opacus]|uniref:hypothetical protein n=1 Tax=Rhodococcus opacus TaxID=37919 RepID=UPI00130E30C7|nr:hypothetical protein [Rhodococcus opacus]
MPAIGPFSCGNQLIRRAGYATAHPARRVGCPADRCACGRWVAEQPGGTPLLGADPHWQAVIPAEVDALGAAPTTYLTPPPAESSASRQHQSLGGRKALTAAAVGVLGAAVLRPGMPAARNITTK